MNDLYFSTFIPGLGEVVREQLTRDLQNLSADLLLDGLIAYRSDSPVEKIRDLRYLNNSFLLLKDFNNLPSDKSLEKMAKQVLQENLEEIILPGGTFRLVFSFANEIVSMDKTLLGKLEKMIGTRYELTVDRTNPAQEFWFLYREEGYGFFGLRLTRHPDWKKVLSKGQLRPELANLLCIISDPKSGEVVLDPFAGSGAIASERKHFPYKEMVSGDISPSTNEVKRLDALRMAEIKTASIDKIITDPPWGISVGKNLDLPKFYEGMLGEFARVLKPQGVAVVLIGNKVVFEEALKTRNQFRLVKKYDILVSGKKAAIYKIIKK